MTSGIQVWQCIAAAIGERPQLLEKKNKRMEGRKKSSKCTYLSPWGYSSVILLEQVLLSEDVQDSLFCEDGDAKADAVSSALINRITESRGRFCILGDGEDLLTSHLFNQV